MPKKMLNVWSTEEILSLIRATKASRPITVWEYREGFDDGLEQLYNEIQRIDSDKQKK